MQIFLAWSGDRSRSLAIRMHEWLQTVVQRAETWISERDIEVGQRWTEELATRIKSANFGVLCITPENIGSTWLHFEAGALAEVVGSPRVVPLLLGIKRTELTNPIAQFQAVEVNKEGLLKLALSINNAMGHHKLDVNIISKAFDGAWPALEREITSIENAPSIGKLLPKKTERHILEDILAHVRSIDRRVRNEYSPDQQEANGQRTWEDYYIQSVNFANSRVSKESNLAALVANGHAISLAPDGTEPKWMARLYSYRGAMLKRLGRLAEARNNLHLALELADRATEADDAMYNLAGVEAMSGNSDAAIILLRQLFERDPSYISIVREKAEYFASLSDNPDYRALTK